MENLGVQTSSLRLSGSKHTYKELYCDSIVCDAYIGIQNVSKDQFFLKELLDLDLCESSAEAQSLKRNHSLVGGILLLTKPNTA